MSVYDGLPTSIRIGPYDHAVIVEELADEEGKRFWGQHEQGQWIKLHPKQPNALFALDTVLHEIIHGLDSCSAVHVGETELEMERMASALATGLVQVLRDNPQLVEWIVKTLGGPTSSDTKTSLSLSSWDGEFLTTYVEPTMASTRS